MFSLSSVLIMVFVFKSKRNVPVVVQITRCRLLTIVLFTYRWLKYRLVLPLAILNMPRLVEAQIVPSESMSMSLRIKPPGLLFISLNVLVKSSAMGTYRSIFSTYLYIAPLLSYATISPLWSLVRRTIIPPLLYHLSGSHSE